MHCVGEHSRAQVHVRHQHPPVRAHRKAGVMRRLVYHPQLQWVVSRFHPDVTVIQTGYWETQDRMFNGAYTTLANPAYAAFIQDNLADKAKRLGIPVWQFGSGGA